MAERIQGKPWEFIERKYGWAGGSKHPSPVIIYAEDKREARKREENRDRVDREQWVRNISPFATNGEASEVDSSPIENVRERRTRGKGRPIKPRPKG